MLPPCMQAFCCLISDRAVVVAPRCRQALRDAGCAQLRYCTLPASVSSVGADPFADCPRLKHLPMPADHPFLALDGPELIRRADGRVISRLEALLPPQDAPDTP